MIVLGWYPFLKSLMPLYKSLTLLILQLVSSSSILAFRHAFFLFLKRLLASRRYFGILNCLLKTAISTSATLPFPCGFGFVASRFFSASLKALSQGNLRRRSLRGPPSATTGRLTNTTLVLGFSSFICGSSLSDYKLEYYNTLSAVSAALC